MKITNYNSHITSLKLSFAFLISIFLLSGCLKNETKTESFDAQLELRSDEEEQNICSLMNPCPDNIKTRTITVGGCPLTVTYNLGDCLGRALVIEDLTYEMDLNNQYCAAINNGFNTQYNNGNLNELALRQNRFYRLISEQIERLEIEELEAEDFDCNNSQTPLTVTFVANTCFVRCQQGEGPFTQVREYQCGIGCCARTTEYCYDREEWQNDPPQLTHETAVCDSENYDAGFIPCNLSLIPCTQNCKRVVE